MLETIKKHLHPLGGHILFWNIAILVFVKIILPHSTFPLATILEQSPLFNSREVIALTNEVRAENNLPPLQANFQLDSAANQKLNDMITNNYFAHVSPSGVTPWFWIKQSNYVYNVAGENLAIGFFTAQDTVDAWFKSSSHRANLLNTKYQEIGIAVGKGSINGHEGIIVVQMFGRPSAVAVQTLPTTVAKPSVSVVAVVESAPQVAAAKTEPESIAQPVSTDENIKPVRKPIVINSDKGVEISNLVSSTNMAFLFYSFAMVITSIIAMFLFNNRSRHMVLKSLVHVSIFLLAILISASEVYVRASIF